MQNVIPLFRAITPDNSDTWNQLCEEVFEFEQKVTLSGKCWRWTRDQKVRSGPVGNRKVVNIRALAYEISFCRDQPDVPGLPVYQGRRLHNTCSDTRCINPDHLTDLVWGFMEDIEFLIRTCPEVTAIPERLGMTNEALTRRLLNSNIKKAQDLLDKYRERQYTESNDVQTRNSLGLHMRRVEKHVKY